MRKVTTEEKFLLEISNDLKNLSYLGYWKETLSRLQLMFKEEKTYIVAYTWNENKHTSIQTTEISTFEKAFYFLYELFNKGTAFDTLWLDMSNISSRYTFGFDKNNK